MFKQVGSSRTTARSLAAVFAVLLGFVGFGLAANHPGSQDAKPNLYIGAARCKNCHQFAEGGNQYGAWQNAKHSSAYDVLATAEAKQVASELGIADPQKSDRCIKCHVTGHGKPKELFKKGFDITLGVQCETCHGPGGDHMRARFRAAAEGEIPPEGEAPPYVKIPDDELVKVPTRAVCYGCHNTESPSFKNFCFFERRAKIRHLDPRKRLTQEERAKLMVCGCGDACGCVEECPDDGCGVPAKE
jgi:hypothetical protein